ncbi:MAG: hypothetical protein ACO2YP_11455, partial [Pseudomonadales bacterium]
FTFDTLHNEEENAEICRGIAERIKREVKDPVLAEKLTPDYPFFCKRVLFIDDYYTTYNKPHVTLVDDPQGVEAITETGVRMASGACHDVDVLIYATGFDSNHIPFPVSGKGGVTLADRYGANAESNWQMTSPQSLWGVHVADIPNFNMMRQVHRRARREHEGEGHPGSGTHRGGRGRLDQPLQRQRRRQGLAAL